MRKAKLDTSSPNTDTLERLALYLEDQDAGFVIVEVNEAVLRDQAVAYVQKRFGDALCRTVDLSRQPDAGTPLSIVRQAIADTPAARIFPIVHFEALAGQDTGSRTAWVRKLNFDRDSFAALDRILIFLFPTWFTDLVIAHAKDFFDFVPVTFSLVSEMADQRIENLDRPEEWEDRAVLERRIAFISDSLTTCVADDRKRAEKYRELGNCHQQLSEYDNALTCYSKAMALLQDDEALASSSELAMLRAMTLGDVAHIRVIRGEANEAQGLYEEALCVYESLGHRRERAVTLGDIARIRTSKGEMDEAISLHEEALRVYESLEDRRERAVTMGHIARIRAFMGDVDKALELHVERLEVFKSLGDRRSLAVTVGDIARILASKGGMDEALSLHEEALRVFKSLGDRRSRAVTLGDIARIRVSKGDVDEALSLHEEALRVYESLGDRRSRAVTLGDIARIRVSKGDVDEARSLQQESLVAFQELGDLDGQAATLWDIARIEIEAGTVQDAFGHLSESYTILLKIDRLDGISMIGMFLGPMLCQAGQIEQGMEILTRSRNGFLKLGQPELAKQAEAAMAAVGSGGRG